MSDVVRLKITLIDTEPAIWRRVEVAATTTLKALHAVIQAAMGWHGDRLFQFEVRGYRVGGGRASLGDLAAYGVKRFKYIYDMGISWEHDLLMEKVLPADPHIAYPRFIDGAERCPREDVGGIPGHARLDALAGPNHRDHKAQNGGTLNADDIDQKTINAKLARIAKRRQRRSTQKST